MILLNFLLEWIVSILAMTAFSVIWSLIANKDFREYNLLAIVIFDLNTDNSITTSQKTVGWLIHFFIGAIFIFIFEYFWYSTEIPRTIWLSCLLGICFGIIGVFGWYIMFKLRNYSHKASAIQYYSHLIIAHVVFCATATMVYRYLF